MDNGRQKRVRNSVITTMMLYIVTFICGLVVPRALLGAYGSEAYGATMSISQFLSYITLLEGGIGGVARAALYKPLADQNRQRISTIVYELRRFFRVIAFISIGYAIVLACTFKLFSHIECYDWATTFWLVLVMAVSTFGQYFIGISYSALIQADQRVYLINLLSIVTTAVNALMVIALVKLNSSLVLVKLISSCVFLLKPMFMWLYVRKKYGLLKQPERDKNALSQRWTGLGQHVAYYIHSNTDIAVLTMLENLKSVSVYSVYHMVTQNIQSIVSAFCSGMEPLFGDLIARDEKENLNNTFSLYETITSIACSVLFSTVYVMIVPFVQLYTRGIEDVNYIQPLFAFLITTASIIYCLRVPYVSVITAAGHFRQTRWGAYGEAFLNLGISIILVWKLGLVGVAIGTVAAMCFRLIYSIVYLSKVILCREIGLFVKRAVVNISCIACIFLTCRALLQYVDIGNYLQWICCGAGVFVFGSILTTAANYIFYRETTVKFFRHIRFGKR